MSLPKNLINDPEAHAEIDTTPVILLADRFVKAGEGHAWSWPDILLSDILTQRWDAEACFVQYHHPEAFRLKKAAGLPRTGSFNLVAIDFDTDPHLPITDQQWAHAVAATAKLSALPNVIYRTHRGIRLIYLIEAIRDPGLFEDARMIFVMSFAGYLGKGWKLDLTRNWNTFFLSPLIRYRKSGSTITLWWTPVLLWHTRRIILPPPPPRLVVPPSLVSTPPSGFRLPDAVRWLRTVPPAVSGQQGNRRTYWVICELVHRYRLDDESILLVMHEWNQRCDPPWTEAEIRYKLTYARKEGDCG